MRAKGTSARPYRPTIRDVASAAETSIGTVSRVLRDDAKVAQKTRKRVLEAMESTGYQPNAAAQLLRSGRSMTIGLLIPNIVSPTFSQVAAGAEQILSDHKFQLLVSSANRVIESEVGFIKLAVQRQMDGLIISLTSETAQQSIAALESLKIPTVILDRDVPVPLDVVYSEHATSMERAVNHLLELGHQRIGYVGMPENVRPGRERVNGYRRAYENAGLSVDQALIRTGQQGPNFGEIETTSLLKMEAPATAIIAGTGDIFPGAMRAIRNVGLSVPKDVSIIGVDETRLADLMAPPATIIARDMVEVGRNAASLLMERINMPDAPPRQIMLPSDIVFRQSTGPNRGR